MRTEWNVFVIIDWKLMVEFKHFLLSTQHRTFSFITRIIFTNMFNWTFPSCKYLQSVVTCYTYIRFDTHFLILTDELFALQGEMGSHSMTSFPTTSRHHQNKHFHTLSSIFTIYWVCKTCNMICNRFWRKDFPELVWHSSMMLCSSVYQ